MDLIRCDPHAFRHVAHALFLGRFSFSLSLYYSCLTLDQPIVNFIIFGNLTTTSFYLVINASPVLIKHQLNTICLSKTYFSFLVLPTPIKTPSFYYKGAMCIVPSVTIGEDCSVIPDGTKLVYKTMPSM